MACWDLQLFLETSVKGPIDSFSSSWVEILFHLKPHNFRGKISTLRYVYFLQVT